MITKQTLLTTLSRFLSNCDKRFGKGGMSPVIIEGYATYRDTNFYYFSPNIGQPDWNAAYTAFIAGTPVLIKIQNPGASTGLIHAFCSSAYFSPDDGQYLLSFQFLPDGDFQASNLIWNNPL